MQPDNLIDQLKFHISYEQSVQHPDYWSEDYTEGYIDGLKRALELATTTAINTDERDQQQ